MSSGFVPLDNGRLYFEKTGNGVSLVLIHAGYLDSRMWANQVTEFVKEGYSVVTYDVRGFGRSSRPDGEYSDCKDLVTLFDHIGLESAVIIGVSNGGRIALDFAVEHPERVMAMILVDSGVKGVGEYLQGDNEELWGDLEELEKKYLSLRGEGRLREAAAIDVDYWTNGLSGEMREAVLNIAEENVDPEGRDPDRFQVSPEPQAFSRLHTLSMPVLVMFGDRDRVGMQRISAAIHEHIRGSRLVAIGNGDHIPSLSEPEKFRNAVLDFLSRI